MRPKDNDVVKGRIKRAAIVLASLSLISVNAWYIQSSRCLDWGRAIFMGMLTATLEVFLLLAGLVLLEILFHLVVWIWTGRWDGKFED